MQQLAKLKLFKFHPRWKRFNLIHMCFADDLLKFCRADKESIVLLKQIFNRFSRASALEENVDKSSIYIVGVNNNQKGEIVQRLGLVEGTLPFKYRGVLLSTKKLTFAQCLPLVEKFFAKITCWAARLLSYAGRIQLIKAVLFGIQNYWAQIFILPKKVIKMLEAICRTYLWIGLGELSRKALISWDKI